MGKTMPERTILRSHTPPKFAALLGERNANLVLEKRLVHFMDWLVQYGVNMSWTDPTVRMTEEDRARLIQEYVNG